MWPMFAACYFKLNTFVLNITKNFLFLKDFLRFQFQKMNFSPFTQFAGLQTNSSLHQFTTAKFAQNITTANGQVSTWNIFSFVI